MMEFKDYVKVKAYSDKMYSILQRTMNGEKESYIHNIAAAFFKCAQIATSREEFNNMMLEEGFKCDWNDEYGTITFDDIKRKEAGEKYYRIGNLKLNKYYDLDFTMETLEETFRLNAEEKEMNLKLKLMEQQADIFLNE